MGAKILVVDDDIINRKLMGAMLKKRMSSTEVLEAENGEEAIKLLQQHGTDIILVLLDIIMPIMDGIDVLQIMRSNKTFESIPVVTLTTDETRKLEAMESGANSFIAKPVRESDLFQKINALINL